MHLDHDTMLARQAMLSGTPALAIVGSHCAHVATALSVAIGDRAWKILAADGRTYETFDEGDELQRNEAAIARLHALRGCVRVSCSDDCSVDLVLATSNGRVEKIDKLGNVTRSDMPLEDAFTIHTIRAKRSLAIANLAS